MKPRTKNNRKQKPGASQQKYRISKKTGLPPGTLVHIGEVLADEVTIHLTAYEEDHYNRMRIEEPENLMNKTKGQTQWVEVCGLHRVDLIERLGEVLKISPLVLEDVLNTEHRPKVEIQDRHLFVTMKLFRINESRNIKAEQISFILGQDFLVSFQERCSPLFEDVRARISNATGKIRQRGPDYLLYSLMDIIVDHHYSITETITDRLDELEEAIFEKPARYLIEQNQLIRKDISALRKALLPMQDGVSRLIKEEPELIDDSSLKYFKDIHDHIIQIIDMLDTCREITNEIRERYISSLSYRMNQVMKLLTIITTIFIPLSFIAGIYGMNFINMPELQWKYGYFYVLGLMFLILLAMMIYFRRKKWI